uniref:Centrosomal protein of 97 kDa n=2 Tax=Lygus hesperus TaxID=30085 RepID=A0A0A9YCG7_LYGHE
MSSCKSPEKSERYFPQFFQEGSTLDLCGQGLTKVPKHAKPSQLPKITQLLLDNNELHRFDNLHQYCSLIEFSASHNDLYRMAQVSSLKHLVRLDLSHNAIHAIDGLKDLVYLRSLNLAHNRLKIIDNLQTNLQLEELDLSGNSISVISNINQLSKLKKFYLHKNCISSLKHCGVYLPVSLETLTLAENKIADLNEISHLTGLVNLTEISIVANPCVQMTGNEPGFDHRPFLINWCSTLKVIDGYAVDDIECLKGEWLYSQGRGRQFRPGQHAALVKYLVEWCPLNNENLQTENERKLRLILSKAHQHQKQLRMSEDPIQPSTSKGKLHQNPFSGLMTQSLDPSLLDSCSQISGFRKSRVPLSDTALTRSLHCEPPVPKEDEPQHHSPPETAPLPAASKLVPVPESLISPMVTNRPPIDQRPLNQTSLAPQAPALSNLVLASSKLQNIRYAAESRRTTEEEHRRSREDVVRGHEEVRRIEEARKTHGGERDQAATCIQKMWRGYHTRNLNPKVLSIYHHLQTKRTNEYIEKLSEEMEQTRNALDSEHRLQILQMQAINALWKKVVSLQPAKLDESMEEVKDLAQTCDRLNAQVQRLQSSMEEVLRCVSPSSVIAMGTQTDIVAVHTPQETSRSQVPTFSAINTANPSTTSVTVCRPLSCWCSQRHC